MAKRTISYNNVICLDDEWLETDQISKVSKITQTQHQEDNNVFAFSVMHCGHSNETVFESSNELEAQLKRKFVIECWTGDSIYDVITFDFEQQMHLAEAESEMMSDDDEEEKDEELN